MAKRAGVETVRAWAWEIKELFRSDWTLCRWAEPSRKALIESHKPSPEARPVCVVMMRNREARMAAGGK